MASLKPIGSPPVHEAVVEMVMFPFKFTVGKSAQTVWSSPAEMVGAGNTVKVNCSLTASHGATPVVVKVKLIAPLCLSEADHL